MGTFVGITGLNRTSQVRVPTLTELDDAPANPAAAAAGSGGSFSTGTKYYVISALGSSGETLPSSEVSAAVTATNEAQRVTVDATAGNFTLTFSGQTTANIAFNASNTTGAASVRARLEGLSNIGVGQVAVTGGPGDSGGTTPYVVTFQGTLANTDVAQMTATNVSLTGGGATVAVATTVPGGSGKITVGWDAVTGATAYRVYRGTSAAGEDHYLTVTAPTHTLVDDGASAGTAGTVPTTHTAVITGGWQKLAPGTVVIVDVDDTKTRKTLNEHRSFGQYTVAAVNNATATAGTLPANT